MKISDLVIGRGFMFASYGIGIVMAIDTFDVIKIYWPKEKVWCITSKEGVKLI
jgi:hypothetical protein